MFFFLLPWKHAYISYSQHLRFKNINHKVVDKNVKTRPIRLKTWTKVEFSGQNDDNNRNIKDSMTIASWEISEGMFLNLRC